MTITINKRLAQGVALCAAGMLSQTAMALCTDVTRANLQAAVTTAAALGLGGYSLPMWVTMVDESGRVCHVVNSGGVGTAGNANAFSNSTWLGSRVISAQKANTANAFSLDGYAISSANLYTPVQPGQSLFGLQESNPVNASGAYLGTAGSFGSSTDPLLSRRYGGVNVFGGGLALYDATGATKIGAIGVSGDTSCRDHAFAWQIRANLVTSSGTGAQPGGVGITTTNFSTTGVAKTVVDGVVITSALGDEMLINDGVAGTGISNTDTYWASWIHPACPNSLGASLTQANGFIVY